MTDWKQVRLDTDRNLPLYSQISDKIRTLIHTGELRKGERIPPTSELQEVFRVSAITVENGINALVEEGILLRRRRLGTFVAEEPRRNRSRQHTASMSFSTRIVRAGTPISNSSAKWNGSAKRTAIPSVSPSPIRITPKAWLI